VRKPLLETSEEEWDEVIDTNLKGVYLCSRAVLPEMLRRKKGVIVNISSGAGKYGFPLLAAYCASNSGS
jgi:3-oxoacyl-[acyl-carrier protein] reductase